MKQHSRLSINIFFIGLMSAVLPFSKICAEEPTPAGVEFFESKIRPVLVETCYKCHSAQSEKLKGGLRLDYRDGLLKGGDNGPVVLPGQPDKSSLIRAIRYTDDELLMPPKKRLSAQQVADVETWVKMGAPDPRVDAPQGVALKPAINFDEARQFWSFQAPKSAPVPKVKDQAWPLSDVDCFILASLEAKNLKPVPPADKRTLIRRATFDLLGLPPTPEEVQAFVSDTTDGAFAKVIDRLLASPHYGERWGRHWLDVVRYADTAGESADYPSPLAYRYRNYTIDAFNQDKPYDQFIREQIAGDILAPMGPREKYAESIIATGYLAISRRFGFDPDDANHLMIEDTIDTLGKSVLGLSIGCARCHDHKFDPISSTDYYALYGIFESTRYAYPGCEKKQRPRDLVPLLMPDEIEKRMKPFEAAMAPLDAEVKKREAEKAAFEKESKTRSAKLNGALASGDIPNGGSQLFSAGKGAESLQTLDVKPGDMLQLIVLPKATYDNDSTIVEMEITELSGQKRTWNIAKDMASDPNDAGKGNPRADSLGNTAVWYFFDAMNEGKLFTKFVPDGTKSSGLSAWRNGEDTPCVMVNAYDKPLTIITAKFPPHCVALHPSPKGGVAIAWESPIAGAVQVSGRIVDADDKGGDGVAWELNRGAGIGKNLTESGTLAAALAEAVKRRDALAATRPLIENAFAVSEGAAKNTKLQRRGDPKNLGDEVPRRFLQVLGGQTLPSDCTGSGRLPLATWLSSPANPLTARVMVNRIWQYHFGRGLVLTSNDFGKRGRAPTHPELLDYLALRFMNSGWSVKQMHKLLMLSQAYRLSCDDDTRNAAADHDNDLLWRFNPRRLEAEEIRDAILAVSGDLDPTPGGAHPFPAENTWSFTQHAPFTAVYDTNRRSVYLMTQRIKRHPFLALFDGADPNSTTSDRRLTTVPTQALYFMNDPFVHAKSSRFAERMFSAQRDDTQRIEFMYQNLYGRPATEPEQAQATKFIHAYMLELQKAGASPEKPGQTAQPDKSALAAWAAYARVLLGSNEFVHLD